MCVFVWSSRSSRLARLASGPPNLTVLCPVLHQTPVFCLRGAGNAL
ncbi:hypothetical protein LOK49_LG14G01502 [Camellia lanceoleosa]|uniref:Uncharacterized protein n=1 Tax=Camellia lanceoleosa TaxID=1840588 RepID=A0ACC0FDL0_9ERIC|nr:hypothetical protein LOK49_LG14G01502 [Camellia lanceoleosa]